MPAGVERQWEENSPWIQAMLLSYDQIRRVEEATQHFEMLASLMKLVVSRG